jgi:hypothetical protein
LLFVSGAVLVRCNVYENADTGKLLADKISRIEVENENTYLLLSTNVYTSVGKWKGAANFILG